MTQVFHVLFQCKIKCSKQCSKVSTTNLQIEKNSSIKNSFLVSCVAVVCCVPLRSSPPMTLMQPRTQTTEAHFELCGNEGLLEQG